MLKYFFAIIFILTFSTQSYGESRKITLVNYESSGVKQWIPGVIAGYKGEELEIKLINKAKGAHGFMIPSHKVMEVVKVDEKKVIKIKLDKAGIFQLKCQLHAAHVGGQLIVLNN